MAGYIEGAGIALSCRRVIWQRQGLAGTVSEREGLHIGQVTERQALYLLHGSRYRNGTGQAGSIKGRDADGLHGSREAHGLHAAEIRESIVANGGHTLQERQRIHRALIIGPLGACSGAEILHGAGGIVERQLEGNTIFPGSILLGQIAHKGFPVLRCKRRRRPAHLHAVIQLAAGIELRAVEFRGESSAILPHDDLFKGKVDFSRRLKRLRDGQGQITRLILCPGRQYMRRQVKGSGLLIRADRIVQIRTANGDLRVIRSIGIAEDRHSGIRGHPCCLHGDNAVDRIFITVAFFQRSGNALTRTERTHRRRARQLIGVRVEAGGGELHGMTRPVRKDSQRNDPYRQEQRHAYGDNTQLSAAFFKTARLGIYTHYVFTSFLFSFFALLTRYAISRAESKHNAETNSHVAFCDVPVLISTPVWILMGSGFEG